MSMSEIHDISLIHSKIIALNYLEEKVQKQAMTFWKSRFAENSAFWVEAKGCSSTEILTKLQQALVQQAVTNMNNETCIIVYLLDATQKDLSNDAKDIWNLTAKIGATLSCNIQLVLQYVYVGTLAMEDAAVQKENIGWVSQQNSNKNTGCQRRLCMIAKPFLDMNDDGGNSWKAAMVLLDVLRRSPSPTSLLPVTEDSNVNNDVGFLRYSEFSEEKVNGLRSRLTEVEKRIDAHNDNEVKGATTDYLSECRKRVENEFAIYAEHQPQHTNMVVVNSGVLKNQQKQAKKGKNTQYNNAAKATIDAVKATAERMQKEIAAFYKQEVSGADKWLKTMIDRTKVSCDVLLSRSLMRSALLAESGQQQRRQMPQLMELKYSESGCKSDIEAFLIDARDYAICRGEKELVDAICSTFDKITEEDIKKKKAELELERAKLKQELQNFPTAEKFAGQATADGTNLPESEFSPASTGGNSCKHLIVRGEKMMNAVKSAGVNALGINEYTGGLAELDSAPMKAVQYITRDYSEAYIKELLKEEI